MYTLARTQKIYGSFQSSFSNIAAQLGRVPLEILKLQAPHFSICFNSFFPPPFIYRQNALPVGVPVMKEHPVIVLSSSFSGKRLRDSIQYIKSKKSNDPFLVISLFPSVRKQLSVFFQWCIRLPFGSSVYDIREILKQIHFIHPTSKCYRVEYGAPFGSLMAAEEQ